MALDAHVVWEMRDSASNNNGGGTRWVSLVNSTYKWTASGSGTNEYYVELAGGGDPGLVEAKAVTTDGTYISDTNGAVGSLNAGEWDWGNNDALGYNTVYVRLDDGADPDTKNDKFVSMVFGGGVDYSMQDAAQLNLADFACVIASTTLTTATGGFTALMVGNLIYVASGTNEVIGWYEITAYTDTNTVTIDRTCCDGVGNATGITAYVGGARALPVNAHYEAWSPGNKMYIEAGTYTLTSAMLVAKSGTTTLKMVQEGYNTVRGDAPVGNDRPFIVAAANGYVFDNYWRGENIRMTITAIGGWRMGLRGTLKNCKVQNTSGSANFDAMGVPNDNYGFFVDCEAISDNGEAILIDGRGKVMNCYAHDSVRGIIMSGIGDSAWNNIVDTMTNDGITASTASAVNGNTIYNITNECIRGNIAAIIWNNQLISGGTGIEFSSVSLYPDVDYNNYYNNTLDVDLVNKGPNATDNNPGFTDAPNGDFSGVDDADGFTIRLGVGA